eukprot:1550636-Pleurochrysis_carterae.AAC.1
MYDVSGRDMIKVQQLLTYAYKEHGVEPEHRNELAVKVHHPIVCALRRFFAKAREISGKGRPSNKLRIALQSVLGAVCKAPEYAVIGLASVARALELGQTGSKRLEARNDHMTRFLDEGILESLYSDRSKIRSDKIGAERLEWLVTDCWCCD